MIFAVDYNLSIHSEKCRNSFFIILGKLATGDIKDSVGESEKSLVSITKSKTKVYLSLHNNVNNSYWHANKTDFHVSRS